MYEYEGLNNFLYTMLYGGAAVTALFAALYLLLRRNNAFSVNNVPPKELRYWTAAFLISAAASHVWWTVIGTIVLADDRLLRNIINLLLDRLTFMPLMMVVLLRLLQDRKRSILPIVLALIPLVGIAVWGIATHDSRAEYALEHYMRFVCLVFIIYYVRALWQYNRWLHDNFADLQHKEVWQSLLFIACVLFVYGAYTVFFVGMTSEFVAQLNTFIIVFFVVWRVETLQQLDPIMEEAEDAPRGINIGALLKQHCEATQLYLQHDLTLLQLATVVGTNRTYLGNYFVQQGITYNAYINQLRINHFMNLYRETIASSHSVTAQQLSQQCGFLSYSTFSAAFKKFKGITVTEWMKREMNTSSTSM